MSTEIEHCEVTVLPSDQADLHHPFLPSTARQSDTGGSGSGCAHYQVPQRIGAFGNSGQIDVAVEWSPPRSPHG